MTKTTITTFLTAGSLVWVLFVTGFSQSTSDSNSADTIYLNGRIYTVDETQPWAEAVAIKDGKFLVVGSNDEVESVRSGRTEVVDLGGKFVMPGLIDSHVHPLGVANSWANLRLTNPTDKDAILAEVKAYAEANPDLPMIRGEAWNLGVFQKDSPRKEWLDEIDSERPIYLGSQTGHSAWANSKALEMAGITKDTPNGGPFVFDVDSESGEPSGTVREFAMGAVERALPPTDPGKYGPALARVIAQFNEYGFTSLKAAEGTRDWVAGAATLDKNGGLNARITAAWEWRSHYSPHTDEEQDALPYEWERYASDRVDPRHVKMFYDGGPDSYTSLLLEDYEGRPGFKGQSNLPKEDFLEKIVELNARGIGVLVHVTGDGGARELVDIFEEVRKRNGDTGAPLHFSHAFMAHPEDIQRLAEIGGAVIDFSPALAYPAPEIKGSFVPPLGEPRYQKWYNVRAAFETGMPVGFGSDWASSLIPDPNGFHQMQSWITRQDPAKPGSETLNVDQRITLEQAVRGFTMGGAEVIGFGGEEKVGSIEEGKLADFIVLDRNIFEAPIADLHKTKVLQTILDGEVVFDREEELGELAVVEIEITNPELDNAIDAAGLNLLVADELASSSKRCCGFTCRLDPEFSGAPEGVDQAFEELSRRGYQPARPAREIYWKNTDRNYWIQWTLKDNVAVLFAYDPEVSEAVEVLRVRDRE